MTTETTSTGQPTEHQFQRRGFSFDAAVKFFFASNAGLTILILLLIVSFLLKEGLGFFPGYRRDLEVYRIAGLEFVDLSRSTLTAHEQLTSAMNRAYFAEINGQCPREIARSEEATAVWNAYSEKVARAKDMLSTIESAGQTLTPALRAKIEGDYNALKQQFLTQAPATPHLSAEERQSLLDHIAHRRMDDSEDPPLVTALSAELFAKKESIGTNLTKLRENIDAFESASLDLGDLVTQMSATVTKTKSAQQQADILESDRATLLAAAARAKTAEERERLETQAKKALAVSPDLKTPMQQLMGRRADCIRALEALHQTCQPITASLPPTLTQAKANSIWQGVHKSLPLYLESLQRNGVLISAWSHEKPVKTADAVWSFISGRDWITGGEWQDFYGILPLLTGSLMIAIVALSLAIPIGVGAAIYTNQFSSPGEQAIIKPVIEFIQAIPSVVLGFIGIFILGNTLRDLSGAAWLQWMPGFPLDERLNIMTAGCLLALMSIPTIFSLSEDALNNVPTAYAEAAEALGASKVQTTFRVIVPAAFSGILAAVLLGLGRVLGETMVVLLVAGNRIKIPDFSAGIGVFFQPCHTLTGIIAQELGEVPQGSVHYRALFVVGILLFAMVLMINGIAQRFVKQTRH